jgi:hypothetical protein
MKTKTKTKMKMKKSNKSNKNKIKLNKNKTNKNKTNKINKFFKLNCSPKNADKKKFTCYSNADMFKLKKMWNMRHPDNKIDSNNIEEIWNKLKTYYNNICNKESCWVYQMTKNTRQQQELLDAFAPEAPPEWKKNPNEWLSSVDIENVMSQYEKRYKCFLFLGPSPIDYDTKKINNHCVWNELCKFDLADCIQKGLFKIGVIFNLDPHYKDGSHWVSLFINIKKKIIFFFDSVGTKIPKQIYKFVEMVIRQGKHLVHPIDFKFDQNYPVEHQYGNTECGMYSIFFIIHMLEDKINESYLKTHILKDNYIEQYRKIFYNENGSV